MSFWTNHKLTVFLACSLLLLSCVSLFVGVLPLGELATSLVSPASTDSFSNTFSISALELIAISRLPRLLAILMAGMGLAVAGLMMQSLCRNKFVSPSTAATIQSAQLGVLLALLFWPASTLMERAFGAFACAMLGTWIFIFFIQKVQVRDLILVPLVGIMFGNIIGGITNFLAFSFDMNQALASLTVGHFSTVIRGHYEIVFLVLPIMLLSAFFAHHFNIVSLGSNLASSLGVNYQLFLFLGLTLAAMLTASIVVVVGTISYIGLIVPNLVTIYKGDNLKHTLLDTALAGALFVLCCDLIGRVIIYPYELPIELIVGSLGSLIFIALIFYRLRSPKGRRSAQAQALNMTTRNAVTGTGTTAVTESGTASAPASAPAPAMATATSNTATALSALSATPCTATLVSSNTRLSGLSGD